MTVFNDYLIKHKPPEKLYHYTSGGGLLGIAKNKEIWASHILYMNDRKEFNLAFEKTKLVYKRMRQGRKLKYKSILDLLRNLKLLADYHIDDEKEDVYVISLSEKKDNLNMWKKYTDMNPGYCLSFDIKSLSENLQKDSSLYISRIIYNKKEQNELIEAIIMETAESACKNSQYPDYEFSTNL